MAGTTFQREFNQNTSPPALASYLATAGGITAVSRAGCRMTVVIIGQSNGDGRGTTYPAWSAQPGVRLLPKNGPSAVEIACVEPAATQGTSWVNNIPNGLTPGTPAYSLCTDLGSWIKRLTGSDVVMVPCAIGSTSLDNWTTNAYDAPPLDTTLFGGMRNRIALATLGDYSGLVFVLVGHEANAGETNETNQTKYINLITALRYWYGQRPVIIHQLGSDSTSQTHANQQTSSENVRQLDQDYGAQTNRVSALLTAVATMYNSTLNGLGGWTTAGTGAAGTVSALGTNGATLAGDGTLATSLVRVAADFSVGKVYQISFTLTVRTGSAKVAINGTNPSITKTGTGTVAGTGLTSGNYVLTATYASSTFSISRNSNGVAFDFDITNMVIQLNDYIFETSITVPDPTLATAGLTGWTSTGTDANNTITALVPGARLTGDGSLGTQLTLPTTDFVVGRIYRVLFTLTVRSGSCKISVNNTNPLTGLAANGAYGVEFTYASSGFGFQRNTGSVAFDFDITNVQVQIAQWHAYSQTYVVPMWDLERNVSPDDIHMSTAGQRENGKRCAYAIALRALGLPGIGYQPPRITGATFPGGDRSKVQITFDQSLSTAGDKTMYTVYLAGVAQTVSSIALNGTVTKVDITLSGTMAAGAVTCSLGSLAPDGTGGSRTALAPLGLDGCAALRWDLYTVS